MTLSAMEFLRRFVQHILPRGFVRIPTRRRRSRRAVPSMRPRTRLGIRFQLHSRPPRQRLPSSLVIESASASASKLTSPSRAEALPMNASDKSGLSA
jgi:hypothetical protein